MTIFTDLELAILYAALRPLEGEQVGGVLDLSAAAEALTAVSWAHAFDLPRELRERRIRRDVRFPQRVEPGLLTRLDEYPGDWDDPRAEFSPAVLAERVRSGEIDFTPTSEASRENWPAVTWRVPLEELTRWCGALRSAHIASRFVGDSTMRFLTVVAHRRSQGESFELALGFRAFVVFHTVADAAFLSIERSQAMELRRAVELAMAPIEEGGVANRMTAPAEKSWGDSGLRALMESTTRIP